MYPPDRFEVGKRLLVSLVDDWATRHPDKKFCLVPNGHEAADGFRDVSSYDIAHATDNMSRWIERSIGCGENETLAYLGANDIRYLIFFLACNKTGYKLFLPSARNTDDALLHLLRKTQSAMFFYTPDCKEQVLRLNKLQPEMVALEVPALDKLLRGERQRYPYTKSFASQENCITLILHTSGTTGLPKPIFLTHGYFAAFDNLANFPLPPGRFPVFPSKFLSSEDVFLTVTPFFHVMGFLAFLQAIFFGIPFTLPPSKPLSGRLIIETIQQSRPSAALLPPSLIENICSTEAGLNCLSRLKLLIFGGAPLSPNIGELLRGRVCLVSEIGITETGVLLSMVPEDTADWSYFEWAPGFNIVMDPVSDDLHELVIRRGKDRKVHGIFHTFPDLAEYRSKDLFVRHPINMNLWKHISRLDDIIVLSNGEKFNPVTMEKVIEDHPLISRAVVVGQNQFQSALLIEPNWDLWHVDDFPTAEAFLDDVWPKVKEANEGAPAYARVMRNRIGIALRNKPFKATPKGSTQRRHVNEDYKEEIEALYMNGAAKAPELPNELTVASITSYLRQIVYSQLNCQRVDDTDDLYMAGYDSLQTVFLASMLDSAIKSRLGWGQSITAQTVYAHPTIASLSWFIAELSEGAVEETQTKKAGVARRDRINSLVEMYSKGLPCRIAKSVSTRKSEKHIVILTGSTGSLGSYLLNSLLNDPSVVKVYCLNRSHHAEIRQRRIHEEKGLSIWPMGNKRVEFVHAAFGEDRLGLSDSAYNTLLETADIVIHNAWNVNFNLVLESFEPMIKSVRDLLEVSWQGKLCPHLFFISSISTIQAWNSSMGSASAPEDLIENPDVVLRQGYAESKHTAERLCYKISREVGVPTTVLRVGQIAGSTCAKGKWNPTEWVPALIATSKTMRKIPDSLGGGQIDWVPVDSLADIIIEVIHSRLGTQEMSSTASFHLVNPSTTSWKSLIYPIERRHDVKAVDFSDWIRDLERVTRPTEKDFQDKPAIKLFNFFYELWKATNISPQIDVRKAKEASPTLAKLEPISADMMDNWLQQWNF